MLNWPPGNIFRQDPEPNLLQIHQNLFGNTQNHLPEKLKKNQKRQIFWKPILEKSFFPINVKSQWDLLTNRALELKYQGRKMQNQKLIW